jgi:hypothetical protein
VILSHAARLTSLVECTPAQAQCVALTAREPPRRRLAAREEAFVADIGALGSVTLLARIGPPLPKRLGKPDPPAHRSVHVPLASLLNHVPLASSFPTARSIAAATAATTVDAAAAASARGRGGG